MKKLAKFFTLIMALVLCLSSCNSSDEEETEPGVCKSGDYVYYAIKISGQVTDYFTFSGNEHQIAVSSTDGLSYFDHMGVVKYRAVTIGGTVVYGSGMTGKILYLPQGFPENKIQNVASTFAMGFISEFMTITQAKKYIPSLNGGSGSSDETVVSCSHDYTKATCTKKATCSKCGATKGDLAEHTYIPADCTDASKCSECGFTYGQALGHRYSDATCTKPKTCARCNDTDGGALGHDFINATCTSPKKCTRCSYTEGEALAHNYVNDVCSVCGTRDPDSIPVGLHTVHVIDSYRYSYKQNSFKDSFGYTYTQYHQYDFYVPYSIHYLNGKYTTFSGAIVAYEEFNSDYTYSISIYADGELKFTKSGLKKTTGKVDFEIDVTGCQQLTIQVTFGPGGSSKNLVAIVNAELTK